MTAADTEFQTLRQDPHTFETLGRVLQVLCTTPGPLSECLGFRLWSRFPAGGYVLSWHGVTPTQDEIVEHLMDAAADDEQTTALRPGDIRGVEKGRYYTTVDVRGVQFQLRPEPMLRPDALAAMGEYWRTGELIFPPGRA